METLKTIILFLLFVLAFVIFIKSGIYVALKSSDIILDYLFRKR